MNLCQRCKLDAENIVHGHLSMSVVPDEKCETWAHKELNNIRLGYRVENSIRWLRRGKEWEVVED